MLSNHTSQIPIFFDISNLLKADLKSKSPTCLFLTFNNI